MERTAVRSRDLAIIGYDQDSKMLEVAFKNGGVYHYREVPEGVFQSLLKSPSHGLYFNQFIKDKYPTTRVR